VIPVWAIKPLIGAGIALLLAAGVWRWHHVTWQAGYDAAQAEHTAALDAAHRTYAAAVREQEREYANRIDSIAAQFERERIEAEEAAAAVVADLRAGSIRLRQQWQGCQRAARVPAAADSPGESDAGAGDRNESAARIVRAARECDAQVRGLQAVIRGWQG
jgi:hypothetical protein